MSLLGERHKCTCPLEAELDPLRHAEDCKWRRVAEQEIECDFDDQREAELTDYFRKSRRIAIRSIYDA